MRKSNVTDDEIGGLAYETYCKAVGGKSFNGDPLPTWDEMKKAASGGDAKKENIVLAWKKAARAVASLVEKKLPEPAVTSAPVPPFSVVGAVSGRVPANPSAPSPSKTMKTRTKCCGSRTVNHVRDTTYSCPCGDTVVDVRSNKDVEGQ